MKLRDLEIDQDNLAAYCREKGIQTMLFFGSITRDDFSPNSDIDVIVDFMPGATPSLWDFAGIELDLTNLWGREVHLHTLDTIHPYLRRRIEAAAQPVYAA